MSLLKILSFIILAAPVLAAAEKGFVEYELALEIKDYESRRACFKFFDAAQGCPSKTGAAKIIKLSIFRRLRRFRRRSAQIVSAPGIWR